MQHHKRGRTFGIKTNQRGALLRGIVRALVLHGSIDTTLAKAKEARPLVERLITKSKVDSVATRRLLASELGNASDVVKKLVDIIGPKYKERAGGYTRIIKLGRVGDRMAEEARFELV